MMQISNKLEDCVEDLNEWYEAYEEVDKRRSGEGDNYGIFGVSGKGIEFFMEVYANKKVKEWLEKEN